MTSLDSILKSRDNTLLTNVHIVKAMIFPVVMYGCESWTIKKAVIVQSLMTCPTLCNAMEFSTPSFPVHLYLPGFVQTLVHWVGDAIQPSHHLSPPAPPALILSQHQGLFQWVSSLYQVAKLLELQLQYQSFQWIFEIDFPLDWLVCSCRPKDSQEYSPASQFKSSSFSVLSLLYGSHLTICTFVSKMMSLLFNMLSRFVIAFLPRSKCLLILWLQSLSTGNLEPKKIKSVTVFHFYFPWSDETRCHDHNFLNVEF